MERGIFMQGYISFPRNEYDDYIKKLSSNIYN